MNFSFKNFLPNIMRDTKWGELVEVWQSIYRDIKKDKINIIFDQYNIDFMSEDDLIGLSQMFGFTLLRRDGYTSTKDFLQKQMLTLLLRMQFKSTQFCFILQGIPFNLLSTGYSVLYDSNDSVFLVDETLTGGGIAGVTQLDGDVPAFLDTKFFPTLDGLETVSLVTRNFIYSYEHIFAESTDEFMSTNTLSVLHNDINQFKRMTDRVYFEPYLKMVIYVPVNSLASNVPLGNTFEINFKVRKI